MKKHIISHLLLAACLLTPLLAKDHPTEILNPEQSEETTQRWLGLWPSLTQEALDLGYDVPLPFGVSATFIGLTHNVEIKNVKAGVNGNIKDVNDFLTLNSENDVQTGIIRFDVFPLPFLNIYAFAGGIQEQSNIDLDVTVPLPGPGDNHVTKNINLSGDLDAEIWGGGINLSGGYKDFFISLDASYSATDLGGSFNETVDIWIYAARLGYRGDIGGYTTALFVGASYWDAETLVTGSIPLGSDTLDFEVIQGPENPWSALVGCAVDITPHWQVQAEYDFNLTDLSMAILGVTYRF